MWYRTSKNDSKKPPQEMVKAMDVFARNAIIKYLRLKRHYAPEERLINSIKQRFFEKIQNDYGVYPNMILYTDTMSLKNLVDQNIYAIIGRLK